MKTLAIMNLKGGTGKTVTAINVAAILAQDYGQRVLLVDADSQCNLTEFMAKAKLPDDEVPGSFASLLRRTGVVDIPDIPTKCDNISLIPADPTLMALDVTSAGNGTADREALKRFLRDADDLFGWTVIDCPPAFTAGAMAALIAANQVLIPMKVDAFSIRGMKNIMEQIRNMKHINRDLTVAGVLPTMVYPSELQRAAEADLRANMEAAGIHTFRHIRRSPVMDRMTFAQEPLIAYSPKSKALHDYKVLVRDLVGAEPEGSVQ